MKKFIVIAMLGAACLVAPAFAEPGPSPDSSNGASEDFASLLRAHPAGGDGLADGVESLLARDSTAAAAIASQAKKLNCDQAAAVALGVSRAVKASKRTDRERVTKIYQPFVEACGNCRPRDRARSDDARRVCRTEEKPDPAQPTRIRNARGEDCFCSLIAGLAAQAYAQGDSGDRMGFYADELSGNGGGAGIGRWIGVPVSGN